MFDLNYIKFQSAMYYHSVGCRSDEKPASASCQNERCNIPLLKRQTSLHCSNFESKMFFLTIQPLSPSPKQLPGISNRVIYHHGNILVTSAMWIGNPGGSRCITLRTIFAMFDFRESCLDLLQWKTNTAWHKKPSEVLRIFVKR